VCTLSRFMTRAKEGVRSWWSGRANHRLILAGLLLIALLWETLPIRPPDASAYSHIRDELLVATVIAGILGFTLEPSMRRAFAKDVFAAAHGYSMPDDFKLEISRIANQRVICIKHIMEVRIREHDAEYVSVNVLVERIFQNISSSTEPVRAFTWVDEWGRKNAPSKINRCEIFQDDGLKHHFLPDENQYYPNLSFSARSAQVHLRPRSIATAVIEYEVTRARNDFLYEQFMTATRNPEIRILEKPAGFDATADFGGGPIKPTEIPDRYELDGVYFHPAPMKVRWWPLSDVENWPVNAKHPDLGA
jgi:hypothetical protein